MEENKIEAAKTEVGEVDLLVVLRVGGDLVLLVVQHDLGDVVLLVVLLVDGDLVLLGVFSIDIPGPFGDVSTHVAESRSVCLFLANGMSFGTTVLIIPCNFFDGLST